MKAQIVKTATVTCLEGSVVEITAEQFQMLSDMGLAVPAEEQEKKTTRKKA